MPIYSDPAPWVPKVALFAMTPAQVVIGARKVTKALLFTVIPLLGFPKYRYLQ